jgi:hypothetical protein
MPGVVQPDLGHLEARQLPHQRHGLRPWDFVFHVANQEAHAAVEEDNRRFEAFDRGKHELAPGRGIQPLHGGEVLPAEHVQVRQADAVQPTLQVAHAILDQIARHLAIYIENDQRHGGTGPVQELTRGDDCTCHSHRQMRLASTCRTADQCTGHSTGRVVDQCNRGAGGMNT